MDKFFFLKNLWLWKCGLPEIGFEREDYIQLKKTEWSKEFEILMRNRLILGSLRYGKMGKIIDKKRYNRIQSIKSKLLKYFKSPNKELLVDIANLCMLEYEEGEGYFKSEDDKDHVKLL